MLYTSDKYRDHGLLLLRIGLGLLFMYHGYPKLTGGSEKWASIGGNMSSLGLAFMPAFWGFMAAFAEFFGGLCLILGLLIRPMCIFLTITMLVAVLHHLSDAGDAHRFATATHAMEDGIVFLSLIWIGPGRFSLDHILFHKMRR